MCFFWYAIIHKVYHLYRYCVRFNSHQFTRLQLHDIHTYDKIVAIIPLIPYVFCRHGIHWEPIERIPTGSAFWCQSTSDHLQWWWRGLLVCTEESGSDRVGIYIYIIYIYCAYISTKYTYIYTLSFQTLKICRVWIGNLGLPVIMLKNLGLCPKPWVSQETLWIQVRLSLDLGLMQLRWGGAGFKINIWKGWWAINNMSKATSIRQQTTNTIEPRVQNKQLLTLS